MFAISFNKKDNHFFISFNKKTEKHFAKSFQQEVRQGHIYNLLTRSEVKAFRELMFLGRAQFDFSVG